MRAVFISTILFVIVAVSALTVVAGVEFPATRAGEIAAEYIASFNSADAEQIRVFETNYRCAAALAKRPVAERVPRVIGITQQLGELEPAEIQSATEFKIEIVVKSLSTQMWLLLKLELEETAPYKLAAMSMMPTSARSDQSSDTDWTTLAELAATAIEDSDMPGVAIAVADADELLEVAVAGVRTIGGADLQLNDSFHVGSVTKSMTATMIACLVDREQLAWDDTVGEALSDLKMNPDYRDVTLLELLTHRAGVPPYTIFSDEEEARYALLSGTPSAQRVEFCREFLQEAPAGPRGEFEYSNAGYTLATVMADTKTGKSWELLLRTHVFEATGLRQSGFGWPAQSDRPEQPQGHVLTDGELVAQGLDTPSLGHFLAPAGDVYMSVADLAAFGQVHLRGMQNIATTVSPSGLQTLHTPAPGDINYACGWFVEEDCLWHAGSAGSFYAVLRVYPKLNRVVAIVTNVGFKKGNAPVRMIADAIAKHAGD